MWYLPGARDFALEYSKERVQFSKPISELQSIRFKLAEMATRIEAARLLTYQAPGWNPLNSRMEKPCHGQAVRGDAVCMSLLKRSRFWVVTVTAVNIRWNG